MDALVPVTPSVPATLDPALDALLDVVIRRGDSPRTREEYGRDLRVFRAWLDDNGLTAGTATRDDLDLYRVFLDAHYALSTTRRRLIVVRALYEEAFNRGLLARNAAAGLRNPRGSRQPAGDSLTRDEAMKLLASLEAAIAEPKTRLLALRDRSLIEVLLNDGLRRSEAAGLRVGQLAIRNGHHVIAGLIGKGNKERTPKVAVPVRRHLDEWIAVAGLSGDDALFPEVKKGGRIETPEVSINPRSVHLVVARRLADAGVRAVRAHDLRVTFATLAREGGATLEQVQAACGHADIRTTMGYIRNRESLDDNAADYTKLWAETA